jgi:NAD(P)-dependent dehydrogenase (short-subunit alcohol dehydrogenase family)
MAVDLGSKVRVNAIERAAINTKMLKNGFESNLANFQKLEQFHPIGKLGSVTEVAQLALSIASDQFSFMHGACIELSGAIASVLHDPDM